MFFGSNSALEFGVPRESGRLMVDDRSRHVEAVRLDFRDIVNCNQSLSLPGSLSEYIHKAWFISEGDLKVVTAC